MQPDAARQALPLDPTRDSARGREHELHTARAALDRDALAAQLVLARLEPRTQVLRRHAQREASLRVAQRELRGEQVFLRLAVVVRHVHVHADAHATDRSPLGIERHSAREHRDRDHPKHADVVLARWPLGGKLHARARDGLAARIELHEVEPALAVLAAPVAKADFDREASLRIRVWTHLELVGLLEPAFIVVPQVAQAERSVRERSASFAQHAADDAMPSLELDLGDDALASAADARHSRRVIRESARGRHRGDEREAGRDASKQRHSAEDGAARHDVIPPPRLEFLEVELVLADGRDLHVERPLGELSVAIEHAHFTLAAERQHELDRLRRRTLRVELAPDRLLGELLEHDGEPLRGLELALHPDVGVREAREALLVRHGAHGGVAAHGEIARDADRHARRGLARDVEHAHGERRVAMEHDAHRRCLAAREARATAPAFAAREHLDTKAASGSSTTPCSLESARSWPGGRLASSPERSSHRPSSSRASTSRAGAGHHRTSTPPIGPWSVARRTCTARSDELAPLVGAPGATPAATGSARSESRRSGPVLSSAAPSSAASSGVATASAPDSAAPTSSTLAGRKSQKPTARARAIAAAISAAERRMA